MALKKRWLVMLPQHQYEWVTDVAKRTNMRGSDLVSELIAQCMDGNPRKFEAGLAQVQLRIKLQDLNDQKAEILEKEKQLQKALQEKEKVTA